jgi:hypothetical protein
MMNSASDMRDSLRFDQDLLQHMRRNTIWGKASDSRAVRHLRTMAIHGVRRGNRSKLPKVIERDTVFGRLQAALSRVRR